MADIEISRLGAATLHVPIRGTAPLLMHKFSEKAKRQMLDAQQGRRSPKVNRDPEADFIAATYHLDDGGYGFPTIGFKAATVSAARFFGKDVTMVGLRQSMFFRGEHSKAEGQQLTRIEGPDPIMREDVVRLGQSGTDLRYRPQFNDWTAILIIVYVKSMLSPGSILSLVDAAGLGVGVGEWRPEKKGDYGTFEVDPTREVVNEDGE